MKDQHWQKVSRIYDGKATEYDEWFENNPLFEFEVRALQNIISQLGSPSLEIGAGSGRFAKALGIQFGIDPALSPLKSAKRRGVTTCQAIGEHLPYADNTFSTAFLLFTECFFEFPEIVFRECHRILNRKGSLVLGMIPGESKLGRELERKSRNGNPYYQHARFRTIRESEQLLIKCGFKLKETVSTLFHDPGKDVFVEEVRRGSYEDAGFVVLLSNKLMTR